MDYLDSLKGEARREMEDFLNDLQKDSNKTLTEFQKSLRRDADEVLKDILKNVEQQLINSLVNGNTSGGDLLGSGLDGIIGGAFQGTELGKVRFGRSQSQSLAKWLGSAQKSIGRFFS